MEIKEPINLPKYVAFEDPYQRDEFIESILFQCKKYPVETYFINARNHKDAKNKTIDYLYEKFDEY